MSEFSNVTIVREANVYQDGAVVSRTVLFADGTKKTLGFMQPGEYEFGTEAPERMEILSGELTVLLPGETKWKAIEGGTAFNVPGNASFKMNVTAPTDYCCSYL